MEPSAGRSETSRLSSDFQILCAGETLNDTNEPSSSSLWGQRHLSDEEGQPRMPANRASRSFTF